MRTFLTTLFITAPFFLSAEETTIDLKQVFSSAPIIYSLLFFLSFSAVMIYIYTYFSSRPKQLMPLEDREILGKAILNRNHSLALEICENKPTIFNQMIAAGLRSHSFGHQALVETMKDVGKRQTSSLWQKVSLLNDIAIVAPMLGLLGTVSGMFYAFYDLNRSLESISALFDGLGISVGTTLAGLIVAILAMILCTLLKYRLTKSLTEVENEALSHAVRFLHEPSA
ncbi:MotA/TolQ/ExbB proton channel family protein [Simkania negevensis]|uniref:Putative biopolymer transport protein exbB homolog n=1 Tax=Simkania negevensis (strain ATCC VR-1471 / DSM 27360 / Z) TaxID=331113 RepID=F8L4Z3_SIMNZ|nr:MotA/TolQ/ExbB proton channel family protein [Simkania negevensis]MCB1068405.1 MotA/TolQ/ExbB proton channel family protein [Simkania sp.]MCP5490384.1 MotA/TolQ/ExbB proton channel family protein [Chlamydiales bacterium]CCB89150.1 putative biopolymer transport protein exbB homolog [Simkania negevensis Z]